MLALCLLLSATAGIAQEKSQKPSTEKFGDSINHWYMSHKKASYERYSPEEYLAIADNLVAYQNEDGGWPKNLDWLSKLDPDSVVMALKPRHRQSTLDNRNIYTQVEYLAGAYLLSKDKRYRKAAERGIEWILRNQYPNGGWRGWDADAITFNDGCISGIMFLWKDILEDDERYDWVNRKTRREIQQSWDEALALILKTQYVQQGVKTVWAQQYDHQTLQPAKARTYEHPSLSAGESADVVLLLMSLDNPAPEIREAIHAAVAWYEKTKIVGKRYETISYPEGHPEDPTMTKDRRLVDDPESKKPLWARYYELEDNTIFFSNRDGVKVYRLEEVAVERRVGYGWYGTWGDKVIKQYKKWKKRVGEK